MRPLLSLFALALTVAGCTEKMITIPEFSAGNRRVLVEELTGVACTNCPDGARYLAQLQDAYGKENLIVVSIHAGSFSTPLGVSQYDFRLQEANDLAAYIGSTIGYPTAAIDRQAFPNYNTPFVPRSLWPGGITEHLAETIGLAVLPVLDYDPATRQLGIRVTVVSEEAFTDDLRLTVVITQDSIVDAQIDNGALIQDYVHRHVLRDVVSKTDGDALAAFSPGGSQQKDYTVTLPANWVDAHLSVVAYVHHTGTPDRNVLQVAEKHVIE